MGQALGVGGGKNRPGMHKTGKMGEGVLFLQRTASNKEKVANLCQTRNPSKSSVITSSPK
jgi:hypothetical protein